ncbi:hypothetical protein Tco_0648180 [Tanacetum coccineum]
MGLRRCKEDGDDVLGSSMKVKVLGLLAQYGVSKVWIRRIKGLEWIRRKDLCAWEDDFDPDKGKEDLYAQVCEVITPPGLEIEHS